MQKSHKKGYFMSTEGLYLVHLVRFTFDYQYNRGKPFSLEIKRLPKNTQEEHPFSLPKKHCAIPQLAILSLVIFKNKVRYQNLNQISLMEI